MPGPLFPASALSQLVLDPLLTAEGLQGLPHTAAGPASPLAAPCLEVTTTKLSFSDRVDTMHLPSVHLSSAPPLVFISRAPSIPSVICPMHNLIPHHRNPPFFSLCFIDFY